jgi:hypothetical protein
MPIFEQHVGSQEIFSDEYFFEAINRLNRINWGQLKDPTVLHVPFQKERWHADVQDPKSEEFYHLTTHPYYLDLQEGLPTYQIPAYGLTWDGSRIPTPLVAVTDRRTQSITHVLMPNFEHGYFHPLGYGLQYSRWPIRMKAPAAPGEQLEIEEIYRPTLEAQQEFKDLFERLAPLE